MYDWHGHSPSDDALAVANTAPPCRRVDPPIPPPAQALTAGPSGHGQDLGSGFVASWTRHLRHH